MPDPSPPSSPRPTEPRSEAEPELTLDDTTKRVLRRALGPVIKLATSTAAIGGLLLFFGFLSQSALFGFAGLPMLTLDPTALVEAGASGIVDSVGLALSSPARMIVITLFLGLVLVVSLYRHRGSVARMLDSAALCLALQLVVLVLLASLLPAEIEIAAKGSPVRWEERVQAAERSRLDTLVAGELDPETEQDRLWSTTYQLRSFLWSPLDWLAQRSAQDPEGLLAELDREVAGYGQPLRLSRSATHRARELYGWLFLGIVLLTLVALGLYLWRVRLEPVRATGGRVSGADRTADRGSVVGRRGKRRIPRPLRRNVVDTSRRIVEPLLVLTAILAVALLPAAHGVLTHRGFGHEEVIVRLRSAEGCSLVEPEPSDSAARIPGDGVGPPGGSEAAEFVTPASVLAAGVEEEPPEGCSSKTLRELQKATDAYSLALKEVIQERVNEGRWLAAQGQFEEAVDALVGETVEASCVVAMQRLWQLRPHPAVFARAPEAAQYFWDRWQDVQARHGRLRFGYILQYPRGQSDGELAIFETVTPQTPTRRGRWALREIRRDCIEETIVMQNPVEATLENVVERLAVNPNSDAIDDLNRYLHPITLRTAVDLLADPTVSFDRRGVLVTLTGTLAGLFYEQEPALARRAADILYEILIDPAVPIHHRRTTATALRLVSGPYAAQRWIDVLEERGRDEMRLLGTATTSGGYLARNAWQAHEELRQRLGAGERGDDGLSESRYRSIADTIVAHLKWIASAEDSTSEQRATACTALLSTGHPGAPPGILQALDISRRLEEHVSFATCMTAAGNAGVEAVRPLLREVVLRPDDWMPAELVTAGVPLLYGLGLTDESELVLHQYLSEDLDHFRQAAFYLEDVEPQAIGDVLLDCAEDTAREAGIRRRCLYGLLLISRFEDGDGGLADRTGRLAEPTVSDGLRETACRVLWELQQRGGIAARFELGEGNCAGYGEPALAPDQRERWERYLEELAGPGAGAAAGPELSHETTGFEDFEALLRLLAPEGSGEEGSLPPGSR